MSMFPLLTIEQANPLLYGAQKVNDIYARILQNHEQKIKNKYLPENLEGQNKELSLKNALSEGELAPKIAAAQYLPKEAAARLGVTNAQLEAINLANALSRGTMGSKIDEEKLELAQKQSIYNMMREMTGDQQPQQGAQQAQQQQQAPTQLQQLMQQVQQEQQPSAQPNAQQIQQLMAQSAQQPQQDMGQAQQMPSQMQQMMAQQPQMQQQQAAIQQPPMTQQERMLKIMDIMALQKGKTPPSLEPVLEGKKILEQQNAKGFYEAQKKYVDDVASSTTALQNLDEFSNAIDKIPSWQMKPYMPELLATTLNPQAQVAIKAGANLMLGELKPLFGGMGQIRVAEINKLAEGLPNIKLDKRAAQEVIGQIRTALEIKRMQGQMAQRLKNYTTDPNDLNATIALAARNLNPVEASGKVHPERLDDWMKYATPEALQAAKEGRNYIPKDVDIKNLHRSALKDMTTEELLELKNKVK